jgi:peptidoglycan/xylan/chitin deacetylase (PgdA/CDA1 family)
MTLEIEGLGIFLLKAEPQERIGIMLKIYQILRDMSPGARNPILSEIRELSHVEIPAELGRLMMLNWDDVREINREGIKIGSHAVTHMILSAISTNDMKREISESKKVLEEGLQQEIKFFSYPNGRYNDDILQAVKAAGYQGAFTTFPQLVDSRANRFELGRILPGVDIKSFRFYISGFFSEVYEVFNLIKRPLDKLRWER